MNPSRRTRVLGLAIGERVAHVAEVSSSGGPGRATVQRVGEFWYAKGADLAHPDALGRALAEFLREQGFTTRVAVIGVPGKWVLTKRVDAPPADAQLVADTLRLQAEGEFGADGGEFAYDYAGRASTSESKPVLLMALPKRQLDQVTAFASAAGIRPVAVAPYAATLAALTARATKNARMLLFGPGGTEFVAQNGGFPHLMRYLGPSSAPPAFLAGEMRRAAAGGFFGTGQPQSGNGTTVPGGELHVWNDARLEAGIVHAFGESSGSTVKLGEAASLGVTGSAGAATQAPAGYAAAVSLAMAGLENGRGTAGGTLPVDFLHSRLAPPKPVRVQRRTLVISGVSALVLLIAAWAYLDIHSRQLELDDLRAQIKQDTPLLKTAKETVARVEFAQQWSSESPQFLACLNDLTKSLPTDGKTFLTSFNLNEQLKGSFSGKAGSADEAFKMVDKMKESGRFTDVKTSVEPVVQPSGKKPSGGQPPQPGGPPQPPQGQPGPQPMPQPPPGGPMPAMPQGGPTAMVVPGPGVMTEVAVAEPSAMTLNMGGGGQVPPEVMAQIKAAQAKAMAAQGQGPGGPPPGGKPPKERRGSPEGGPPAGAGAPPSGEVTFSMSFNYQAKH